MSKVLFLLVLALPGALCAQTNAADYNLTIHVTASRIAANCTDVTLGNSVCRQEQQLTADVGSGAFEMSNMKSVKGIVTLGDYKAKLVQDKTLPTNEFTKTYEILFPDGSTRKFDVTGQLK
jgi:type 1 fimbria pilin